MNFPCPSKITCPCPDSPLANLSSEAPDPFRFFAVGYARPIPPLGTAFTALACSLPVVSTVSQADADLQAALQSQLCATNSWTNPVNGSTGAASPPVPPPAANRGGAAFPVFKDTAQLATVLCPDGSLFPFLVPAGEFTGRSQLAADQKAISYGTQQANLHRLCLGAITLLACAGAAYDQTITVASKFFTGPVVFALVGGTLPPGLTLAGGRLFGTPSTPGAYDFTISATLPNGDTNQREYFLTVAGLTNGNSLPVGNVGTAYSAVLTTVGFNNPVFGITDAPLPAGLALFANGTISGTPTTPDPANTPPTPFTVTIRDSVTGFECSETASIAVHGINFNNLTWTSDVPHVVGGGATSGNNAGHVSISSASCLTANPSGASVNFTGALNYTGPLVNCNVNLAYSIVGPQADWNLTILQDAVPILTLSSGANPPGNYAFTLVAGVNSLIQCIVNPEAGRFFLPALASSVALTCTFTPAA